MLLRKAVITAAGLGTRLLPATKEMPKEMLPLFYKDLNGNFSLKPVLQLIFEQLYAVGFREFCFVVGRGKRSVEDHFTPDWGYIELLKSKGKPNIAEQLEAFYKKVESSTILWVNQPKPRGFGDAVLKAESFIDNEPFIVHAGDTYVVSKENSHIKRLINHHMLRKPSALLILKKVSVLQKIYGCALADPEGDVFRVRMVIEKPEKPPSNLAVMPIYTFESEIFDAIRQTKPSVGGEVQLTDAIQKLIDQKKPVEAIKLKGEEARLDVGTPETYWEALKISHDLSLKGFL